MKEINVLNILQSIGGTKTDKFADRMKMQKWCFLIQQIGKNEEYQFTWYVRGTYSRQLARTVFGKKKAGLLDDKVELTKQESQILEKMKEFLGEGFNDTSNLELHTSAWYWLPDGRVSKIIKERIVNIMRREKPQFDEEEVRDAMAKVISFRAKL